MADIKISKSLLFPGLSLIIKDAIILMIILTWALIKAQN